MICVYVYVSVYVHVHVDVYVHVDVGVYVQRRVSVGTSFKVPFRVSSSGFPCWDCWYGRDGWARPQGCHLPEKRPRFRSHDLDPNPSDSGAKCQRRWWSSVVVCGIPVVADGIRPEPNH